MYIRAQLCVTLCDPMDCSSHQVPLSMRFSRQEYSSGLPLPFRDLSKPGIKPASSGSLNCQADSLPLSHLESLSPLILGAFVKISWLYSGEFYPILSLIFLYLYLYHIVLITIALQLVLISGSLSYSTSLLLFKIVLATPGSLHFHINFQIS